MKLVCGRPLRGGVYIKGATVLFTGCNFYENVAGYGAGVAIAGGDVTFTGCNIYDNKLVSPSASLPPIRFPHGRQFVFGHFAVVAGWRCSHCRSVAGSGGAGGSDGAGSKGERDCHFH